MNGQKCLNIYSILTNIQNSIHSNKCKFYVENAKCNDYYWHLITKNHLPKAISVWGNMYTNFKNKDDSFSKTMFKMPFICTRDTVMQTFQYKIIHRTLACNECLKNIKIKTEKHLLKIWSHFYMQRTLHVGFILFQCFFFQIYCKKYQNFTKFHFKNEN